MKPVRLALTTLLAAGAAALVVPPTRALAQYPGGAGGPNTALQEARKNIQLAEKEVVRIRQDMAKIKARIQSRYEGKDDWDEAQKNLKAAQAAEEAAKKKAMAKLVASPEYKAAKEKQTKADAQLVTLNAQGGKADAKALAEAQQARIDSALIVRKLESDAMENDPKVVESKTKVAEAKKASEAMEDELKQALEQDPDYQSAQQELETAQANVTQMKQSLAQQVASERQARRAQMESQRQTSGGGAGRPGGGNPYGGGGRAR
jgi:hypothetical protein